MLLGVTKEDVRDEKFFTRLERSGLGGSKVKEGAECPVGAEGEGW